MANNVKLGRLSLVGKYARYPVFIGWDENGAPAVLNLLSREAQADFDSAKSSGASFPELPSNAIHCFEYTSLGKAIDYPGSAEDVIPINVRNEMGVSSTLNLGEGTVLRALEWALDDDDKRGHIWNSTVGMGLFDDGSGVVSTTSMYTLIFQDSRVENGALCALLFKPIIERSSNESLVFRFARSVIKQLLVIDESQPPRRRKGYILVAAKVTKGEFHGGIAGLIFDMNDQSTQEAIGKAKANGIRLLRAIGIADTTDEYIAAIEDPLPTYNIDSLDLRGLAELVSAMKALAPFRNRS